MTRDDLREQLAEMEWDTSTCISLAQAAHAIGDRPRARRLLQRAFKQIEREQLVAEQLTDAPPIGGV